MISIIAVLATVIAESLIAYGVSELFAAGYDNHRHAASWPIWLLIGLTAYSLPGAAGFFNLKGKAGVLLPVLAAYLVVYGAMRFEFSGDLKLWDFSWIPAFADNDPGARRLSGPVAITTVVAALLWTRATYRANSEIDLESLPRSLAGSFALATFLVIAGTTTERAGEVGRAVAAFFASGVLALSLSQLAMSGTTIGEMRAGSITGVLLAGIAGVTLGAVALFGLVFGLLGPIIGPPLGTVVGFIFALILTPPTWLLAQLIELLFSNADFPSPTIDGIRGAQDASNGAAEDRSAAEQFFLFGARMLALIVFIAVVAAPMLLYWTLRKRASRKLAEGPPATSVGNAIDDLRSMLNFFGRRGHSTRTAAVDDVGRLYRDVLEQAENEGRTREPSQTPAEFAPVLVEQFHTPVTDDITSAFIQARYGGRRLDERQLRDLEACWQERKRQSR